jgi:hypothetical protein
MLRRALAALAVAFLGSLLSGCGGGDGSVLHSGDALVLVGAEGDMDGPNAGVGFGGSVAMVGHCLGIEGATVIWPYGTTIVSGDPLTIDVPGWGRVKPGVGVSGGAVAYADSLPKGIDAMPSGCPTTQVLAFDPTG